MKVVFWGTPDFGIPTLRALIESEHEVVGVVTNPDRPAGRGQRLAESPVKRVAVETGIPLLQPERPRGAEFVAELATLEPDVSVVAAYGQLLVEDVLETPRFGSINVHASLLPELRGAAPINWAIIRGHERSGVTIMRMVKALDAGPILLQEALPLGPTITAGELFERVSALGPGLTLEALEALARGEATGTPQDDAASTYAPKLDRDQARLDWTAPAAEVDRWIRGCDPWPGAWSEHGGRTVQWFESSVDPAVGGAGDPGRVLIADPSESGGLWISAGDAAVRVGAVRPSGGRRMSAADWVRGRAIRAGDRVR